jgi:hypothetical protein
VSGYLPSVRGHLAWVSTSPYWPRWPAAGSWSPAACVLLPSCCRAAVGPFVCQRAGLLALTCTIILHCDATAVVLSTLHPPAPCPPLSIQSHHLAVYGAARTRLIVVPSSHGVGGQLLPRPHSAQARHARPNPSLFPLAPLLLGPAVPHINLAGGVIEFDSTRPQLAD